MSPENPFSLKLATANPTIFAQHPTVAAPPANPLKFSIIANAAELIGSVNIIPINTDTNIPIIIGCLFTAQLIISPRPNIKLEIEGPISSPTIPPKIIVKVGTKIMSNLVLP